MHGFYHCREPAAHEAIERSALQGKCCADFAACKIVRRPRYSTPLIGEDDRGQISSLITVISLMSQRDIDDSVRRSNDDGVCGRKVAPIKHPEMLPGKLTLRGEVNRESCLCYVVPNTQAIKHPPEHP